MSTTYWTALGIARGATPAEIKAAYRKIAAELHPDRIGGDAKLKLVNAAYNVLKTNPACFFGGKNDLNWAAQYEKEFEIIPAKGERSAAQHLADSLRDQAYLMEQMRRRAAARKAAEDSERLRRMAEDAARARKAEEDRINNEADAKAAHESDHGKEGQCGHHTKSGPCVRPANHTPNGHMSAEVLRVKTANAKAKRDAAKK